MAKYLGIFRQNYQLLLTTSPFQNVCRNYVKAKPKKENPYILVRALPNDYKETIELMWDSYYPHEPTVASLGLGHKRNALLDEVALHCLAEGVSVLAKCKYTGKIVGACLNGSSVPWDSDELDRMACGSACVQTRHLLHFWAFLQKAPQLWAKFEVQKVMELSHLFVKRSERGKGLARQMIISSVDSALDTGYTVIRVDATNFYTAKICQELNFRLVYELPFCTYMGQDNKPVFTPRMPHRSAKVYVFESNMHLKR